MLDRGDHNSRNLQKWVEGEPVRNFWTGLDTKDRDKYVVATWRCDSCGYLESYAKTPSK